jgi:hypothetical protein
MSLVQISARRQDILTEIFYDFSQSFYKNAGIVVKGNKGKALPVTDRGSQ